MSNEEIAFSIGDGEVVSLTVINKIKSALDAKDALLQEKERECEQAKREAKRWQEVAIETEELLIKSKSSIAVLVSALEQASKRCENSLKGLQPPHESFQTMNTFVVLDAVKRDCDEALATYKQRIGEKG